MSDQYRIVTEACIATQICLQFFWLSILVSFPQNRNSILHLFWLLAFGFWLGSISHSGYNILSNQSKAHNCKCN